MRAKTILFFLIGIMLSYCCSAEAGLTTAYELKPDSLPGNILIINSFDAMSMKTRKNKKELFAELTDSLKQLLNRGVWLQYKTASTIFPGLLPETENSDSSMFSLMANNGASRAIVIKKLDVYFDQTGVEVTGVKHDKTRKASYDICAVVTYSLYNRVKKLNESETNICEHYTVRNVVSGLLATGPDVVGKRKDAFKIIEKNAEKYLRQSFDELSNQ